MLLSKNGRKKFSSVLITGAANGLGKSFAIKLSQPGTSLALSDTSDLSDTIAKCRELGATISTSNNDIRSKDFVRWAREIDKKTQFDLVIANAGISPLTSRFGLDVNLRSSREILEVNILGSVNTVNAILGKMLSRNFGHILIVSSIDAYNSMGDSPAYCSSKAALLSYGKNLKHRLKGQNVKVTVACPGYVETQLTEHYKRAGRALISAEECVDKILEAVYQDKGEIVFPRLLAICAKLTYAFPSATFKLVSF